MSASALSVNTIFLRQLAVASCKLLLSRKLRGKLHGSFSVAGNDRLKRAVKPQQLLETLQFILALCFILYGLISSFDNTSAEEALCRGVCKCYTR